VSGSLWLPLALGFTALAGAGAAVVRAIIHGKVRVDLYLPMLGVAAGCAALGLLAALIAAARSFRGGMRPIGAALAGVASIGCIITLGWLWKSFEGSTVDLPHSQSATASTSSSRPVRRLPPLDEPNATRIPEGGKLPLAEIIPQRAGTYTPQQVAEMWPAFQHVPFEQGGFNAISLPFRYSDPDSLGDANEANAFAFLLSNALDWAPGDYCTRHAYFVFKRSRDDVVPLRKEYNHAAIAALLPQWHGTHAIGGSIARTKDGGYTGTLEIFSRAGPTVLTRQYEQPRPYFELLGDMAADAMRFLGNEPSAALVEHLKKPRCRRPESIALLGSAAFMEEKSDEEFRVYQKIVEQDPQFAEVHYWWANQKRWRDNDVTGYVRQEAMSLETYLTEAALADFDPERCTDRALASKYPQWLALAEKLMGADHPTLLRLRVEAGSKIATAPPDMAMLERGVAVAARYPNRHYLTSGLGDAFANVHGPTDLDLAASLYFTGRRDLYVTAMDDKWRQLHDFASVMILLGHNDIAAQALSGDDDTGDAYARAHLIEALFNMGRFEEALAAYRKSSGNLGAWETPSAAMAAVAAAIAGRLDELESIRKANAITFGLLGIDRLLGHYVALLHGETANVGAYLRGAPQDWALWQWNLLLAQADLINQRDMYRDQFNEMPALYVNNRLGWLLLDGYERMKPSAEGPAFYETLQWLHGDDPWVIAAVAEAREKRKVPTTQAVNANEVLKLLADMPAVRWPPRDRTRQVPPFPPRPSPWAVAAAIHQLLPSDRAKAQQIAFKYYAYTMRSELSGGRVFANHLIHMIEQAH
jgi:hypothetical protein